MAVGIPNFPTSLDAASDLVEATNNASTTINMVGGLSNSATTITVVSTAAFPSTGIIRIDDELISYSAKTSTTFTVQTRGFESSTAASHNNGATVSLDITAASNNAKNTAIIALETKVGTGSSTPSANTVLRGTGTGTSAFGQVGLTTDVTGTLPAANGGTGITTLGSGVATFLGTPSSANLASAVTDETGTGALVFGTTPTISRPTIDNPLLGYTTTVMTGGTTTLTNTSNFRQFFTGDTNFQDVVLPVASTMVLGQGFEIHVNSIYYVTVRSSDNSVIANVQGGQSARVTCILTSGTGTSSWDLEVTGGSGSTGTGNLVFNSQPLLSLPSIGSTGFFINGSSGGSTKIVTSATGSGTVTIPAGDATLATTLNARAFKNALINGDMQVAQRGTSATGITTSGYNTADRWRLEISSLGTFTQTVETTDPAATDLTGFRQSLKMNCTTADSSPAAGDYAFIQQRIEGQNVQHFLKGTSNARQFTLSFWVKSTTTGTYVAELFDNSNTRHVAATYSVSSANTWEFKTITFPADTSGVLANTNGFGLAVNFWIGSGTTYTSGTLATTWASVTNANRAAGLNVNIAGATARTFAITGVQLEPGSTATPYEYLPIDVQFNRCLRYLYRVSGSNWRIFGMLQEAGSPDASLQIIYLPQPLRAAASLEISSISDLSIYYQQLLATQTPTTATMLVQTSLLVVLVFNLPFDVGSYSGTVSFAFGNANSFMNITAEL